MEVERRSGRADAPAKVPVGPAVDEQRGAEVDDGLG